LAKICPDCFKSKPKSQKAKSSSTLAGQGLKPFKLTKPESSLKQQGLKPFKPANIEKSPKKTAGAANIAQVCPQCFKKKETTLVVDNDSTENVNSTIEESSTISASTTENITSFETFEDFSTLPDNVEPSTNNANISKKVENNESTETPDLMMNDDTTMDVVQNATAIELDEETVSDEQAISKESESLVEVVKDTKIEIEDLAQQSTTTVESTNKPILVEIVKSEADLSIEENEPRSLISTNNTENTKNEE